MSLRVTIVYNRPSTGHYAAMGESAAVDGVLSAVEAVEKALQELNYRVQKLPLSPPESEIKHQIAGLKTDVIFNLFEGFDGKPESEALIPEIAAGLQIPYTGCARETILLALDKSRAKDILKSAGIRTPDYQVLSPETIMTFNLTYPCIVKPLHEDASHGLTDESIVKDFHALKKQIDKVTTSYGDAMVEKFLEGREFNAGVMGNRQPYPLPVSEIVYRLPENLPKALTYAAKWDQSSVYYQGTTPVCPAEIHPRLQYTINALILKVYRLFKCRSYARVDMRMDGQENLHVIEINPNPDISPDAGITRQAAAAGMSYPRFVETVIGFALEREL